MTDQKRKVQTEAVMDVTGVERAAQDAVRAAGRMADGISREGARAGEGIEAIGEGAKRAERSVDAATKSISDKIRRSTVNAQREIAGLASASSGGAGSASALQYEGALRGADVAKLQPQITALRELQAQANALSEAMRRAAAGEEFVASINARVQALQRQSGASKTAEADLLALRAAEMGVSQQADPLIAKLREAAKAADEAAAAGRRAAAADSFLTGLNAQATAIGKTRAELLELKAAELGVTAQAAPMIAAIRKADGELMGIGKNAKMTAAALRTVPAQFTDIVVSLQAGQNPLQVFLQQGGQLKDQFGGIGAAARAMGGYVLGLVNPMTLAAVAAGAMVVAFQAGSNEITKLQQAAILSGDRLGVTAGQLQAVAKAVADLGGGTQGAASEFLAEIARTGNVAAGDLQRFTDMALRMERVGGPAAKETAKAFAELGKEPLQASLKLTEQYNYLTASTYEQIKALEQQGKATQAAAVAQRAFFDAMSARVPEMESSLGYLERLWKSLAGAIAAAGDQMKKIGRATPIAQEFSDLQASIKDIEGGKLGERAKGDLPMLRERSAELRKQLELQESGAVAAAAQARQVQALGVWDREAVATLDKKKQLEQEIDKARQQGLAAGKSEEDIQKRIGAIREKYADKGSSTKGPRIRMDQADLADLRAYANGMDSLQKISLDAAAGAEQLSKSQAKLREIQASPAWGQYSRQQQEQLIYAASLAQADEDRAESQKKLAKLIAESQREYSQWLTEQSKGAKQAEEQAQKLRDEAEAVNLVIPGYRSLEQALVMVEIARLRERQVAMMGNEDAVAAIEREIKARQKLVQLIGQADKRKAADDEAKRFAQERQREQERIGDALTDALMSAFEKGKSFAVTFRDTVANMFKTLVLKPIIQAIVNPVAATVTGALGIGSPAYGSSGVGGQVGQVAGVMDAAGRMYDTLKGGFDSIGTSVALAADKMGEWLVMKTTGVLNQAGGTLMQYAGSMGTIASSLAGATTGLGLRSLIGGKYEISSGYSSLQQIGTLVATAVGGPVLGAIVGAASGLINRAFGMGPKKTTAQGIVGGFTNGEASAEMFADWKKDGGWFRSDKRGTDFSPVDKAMAEALGAGAKAVLAQTQAYAKVLQLPADILSSVTSDFKVTFTDDAEKNKQAIADAITAYSNSLSASFKRMLAPFQKAGEELTATLERLAILQKFSEGLNMLGGVFSKVAGQTVAVREEFIGLFGSMDNLAAVAKQFAQDYYNRDEIAGVKATELQTVLASVGIDSSKVTSKDDYRRLVESADVTTQEGRTQLAALLQASSAFTSVAEYMAETGANLADVAKQAPTGGALANILSPDSADLASMQVDATLSVRDAVRDVGAKLQDVAAQLLRQQEELLIWSQEVGGGA